jgi:hypothetical protein
VNEFYESTVPLYSVNFFILNIVYIFFFDNNLMRTSRSRRQTLCGYIKEYLKEIGLGLGGWTGFI